MSSEVLFDPAPSISQALSLSLPSVRSALELLTGGATIPFVARYRKEATGGLDEVQLRDVMDLHEKLSELEKRRKTILKTIEEQGKLTPALRKKIMACTDKTVLEDLYLPYKPKRKTRASMARARGLEPLANLIWNQTARGNPQSDARRFTQHAEVKDVDAALAGARDIVAEWAAEKAEVRASVRRSFAERGELAVKVDKKKVEGRTRFEEYYDFGEPLRRIPSHRYMAICRGEKEGILKVKVNAEKDRILARLMVNLGYRPRSPFADEMKKALEDAYKRLLVPSSTTDVRGEVRERAELAAVDVFASNLRDLLMSAPFGGRSVVGIDPGLRTGCKCAALSATGTYLESMTFYLTRGDKGVEQAEAALIRFVKKHKPEAIAVGNGTGGRDTESFVRKALKKAGLAEKTTVVLVNEAGASIYSASDIAREEFPELDLTIRGAISIGRRLQDPLAELVKIDPKSIGVGQYQHDVQQTLLQKKLAEVVESCVNNVGVDLNTASAPLLSYVAGVGPKLAQAIVVQRESLGGFSDRKELLKVSGLGPKKFEQAAGFMRIRGARNPLDNSAVHPERYKLVQKMASDLGVKLSELVGNPKMAAQIDLNRYVGGDVGLPTLRDIVSELGKPGRDPREVFEAPQFREGVDSLDDLVEGMTLEGVVTNVTNFGAFVDVGVKQDGLVHISQLADRFVRDPRDVVRAGQKIQVRVLSVDKERKRISLSAKKG